MNLVTQFVIDEQHYIEVLVPSFGKKENSFCDPTPLLHNCDFVTAYLVTSLGRFIIYDDILQTFISYTLHGLEYARENKLVVPNNIQLGEVGYFYNVDSYYRNDKTLKYSSYWIWSAKKGFQSWVYNKNNNVYLEISPSYPYLYEEAPVKPDTETFQKFIDNYKPILCTELSATTINTWIDQCKYLDETIDRPSKRKM